MEYNFNIPLVELNGKGGERTLADCLAEIIGSETKGHTLKLFGWMMKLQSKQPLELDDVDRKMLYDKIENREDIFIFIKGQLLETLK